MEIVFFIARIIVGIFYLNNARNHFFELRARTGYAQSKGIPAPKLAVLVSGLLLLIAGLSILSGYQPTIGVIALILFFLPVTFTMHAFWKIDDPMARMADRINLAKNLALLGSALMFLAIPQPWPISLG